MKRLITLCGTLALIGVIVTACTDDADILTGPGASTTSGGAGSSAFSGRTFVSTGVTGHDLIDGTSIILRFEGPNLSRNAGCNTVGSGYTTTGGRLTVVGEAFSTLIGCDPEHEAQDQWLQAFLEAAPTYAFDGSDLRLTNGDESIALSAEGDDDSPLVGTLWTLETIIADDTVSAVPTGVTAPTIEIGEDGMAELSTGCNTGGAGVGTSISEDGEDTLHFGALRTTKMACEDAAMELEATVLAVLDSGPAFRIDGDSLELTARDGTTLTYRAL